MGKEDQKQPVTEEKYCPYWQKPCSEVCDKCVMYMDINKQGKLGIIKGKMCAIVLEAQKPPVIMQQGGMPSGGVMNLGRS